MRGIEDRILSMSNRTDGLAGWLADLNVFLRRQHDHLWQIEFLGIGLSCVIAHRPRVRYNAQASPGLLESSAESAYTRVPRFEELPENWAGA